MGESAAQMLGHEEIVRGFIGTKAVDFEALGQFVAKYGESIVISGRGDYGVRFGHYNIHACFKIAGGLREIDVIGQGLAGDVVGR
jgi:hypothetical protein